MEAVNKLPLPSPTTRTPPYRVAISCRSSVEVNGSPSPEICCDSLKARAVDSDYPPTPSTADFCTLARTCLVGHPTRSISPGTLPEASARTSRNDQQHQRNMAVSAHVPTIIHFFSSLVDRKAPIFLGCVALIGPVPLSDERFLGYKSPAPTGRKNSRARWRC